MHERDALLRVGCPGTASVEKRFVVAHNIPRPALPPWIDCLERSAKFACLHSSVAIFFVAWKTMRANPPRPMPPHIGIDLSIGTCLEYSSLPASSGRLDVCRSDLLGNSL